ncbi:MAG: hypothetical protein JWN44_5091 [Myxococcales bacterium]|nr:hypothetical protein [Myxococcales bacterium]
MQEALISRVRGILLSPKQELPKTIAEPGDFKSLLPYVVVLLAVGALADFLSAGVIGVYMQPQVVFGMKIGGGFTRAPVQALIGAVLSVGMGVGVWWFYAFVLDALSGSFGARKDMSGALKVAAYSATPFWIAGVLGILRSVPYLGWLTNIGRLAALVYAVMVGIWALPILMGTPENKAAGHILAALAITVLATVAVWFVVFSLLFGMFFAVGAGLH